MLTVHYSACTQRCQGRTGHGSTVQLSQECFHRDFAASPARSWSTIRRGAACLSLPPGQRWSDGKKRRSATVPEELVTVAHHFSGGLACLKAARPGRDDRFTPYARLAVRDRQVTKRFDRPWRDGYFLLRLFPTLDARSPK
jgi:hypothetical protein